MARVSRLIYEFASIGGETPARSSGSVDTDPFVATLANAPIVPGSITGSFDETSTATTRNFVDTDNGDGTGVLTGTGCSGTINYLTGEISLSSDANEVDDSTVSITYLAGIGESVDAENLLTVDGTDVVSAIIYPNRINDEEGIFQVEIDAANDTPVLVLQGRAGPDCPWMDVDTFVNSAMGTNNTAFAEVVITPEMRMMVRNAGTAGIVKMSGWIME